MSEKTDKPEISLSKTDVLFLALVSSGAVQLEKIAPEFHTDEGSNLYYVPELKVLYRNLRSLQELYLHVCSMVKRMDEGQDVLQSLDS